MVPSVNVVDTLHLSLFLQTLYQFLSYAVHTSHGRHNPYLVAHTNFAILTLVSLKGSVFLGYVKFLVYRVICVIESAREISLQVVLVYPCASLQVSLCVTYRVSVFDDVLALFLVSEQHLVTCWCVLEQCYILAVNVDYGTF